MKAHSYPIQLSLHDRSVLVVGAGLVAARKLERLIACGARVRVVARELSESVRALARAHQVELHERAFREDDVRGCFMVIAATNDAAVNEQIARSARDERALVLRVDAPEQSDFTLPALAQAEHVDGTVSTRGEAPAASRRLARELSAWLANGPERFVVEMARARVACAARPDGLTRLRSLADGPLLEACRARDEARISELMSSALGAP